MERADLIQKRIRVAVIGCGQISDAHLGEIKMLKDAELVGVCDLYEVLAKNSAERFDVKKFYTDYRKMVDELKPDVIHITTPAHTHLPIGIDVLKSGCHAYVEKPFGINYGEAEELINQAQRSARMVCGGFSQWFDRVAVRFRDSLKKGALGEVVHFESYYGNSMDGNFSKILLKNKEHWVNRLPGKMFHNIVSHALYHVIPLLPGPIEKIFCIGYDGSGNGVIDDELRVLIKGRGISGYLTISSAVKPVTQFVRVYGTKGMAEIDFANHIYSVTRKTQLAGVLGRLESAFSGGSHFIREGLRNSYLFSTGKDRFFAGMGGLFQEFYKHIREGKKDPPIPYEVVLNVSKAIDLINENMSKEKDKGQRA